MARWKPISLSGTTDRAVYCRSDPLEPIESQKIKRSRRRLDDLSSGKVERWRVHGGTDEDWRTRVVVGRMSRNSRE